MKKALYTLLVLALAAAGPLPARAEGPRTTGVRTTSLARGPRAFSRDLRRLARIPRIRDLSELLRSRSSLTRSLVPRGQAAWHTWNEGPKDFKVDLGGGLLVTGKVHRYEFPNLSPTIKLLELKVEKGGRARSLMPAGRIPINIEPDTAFYYDSNRVSWHGPQSRFALLALFHELGHVKELDSIPEVGRQELKEIYDKKTDGRPLARHQVRQMVGFERRAYAHALREMRALKRDGFDILAGVPGREVLRTIHGCLKGYYEYTGSEKTRPATRSSLEKGWPGR